MGYRINQPKRHEPLTKEFQRKTGHRAVKNAYTTFLENKIKSARRMLVRARADIAEAIQMGAFDEP